MSQHIVSSSNTRLISSYFQSTPKKSEEYKSPSPANTRTKEPSLSPEPEPESEPAWIARIRGTDNMDSSDTFISDNDFTDLPATTDSVSIQSEPRSDDTEADVFHDAQEYNDSPIISPKSPELLKPSRILDQISWRDELEPIDNVDLMPFSSQASGESLRRLALSPRKQIKKKDILIGSTTSKPELTFAQKLAAELGDSDVEMNSDISIKQSLPIMDFGENSLEPAVVEGSDSGSEADWNDEEFAKPDTTVTTPPPPPPPESPESSSSELSNVGNKVSLDSDDDMPTLSKFNTKVDWDSGSDLDDDPFSSKSPALSPPSQTESPFTDNLAKDDDLDLELSDHEHGIKTTTKKQGARTSTPSRPNRSLRSSTIKSSLPPMSPPRPVTKPTRANKKPPIFSLDTLLSEKNRKAKIGYDIATANKHAVLDNKFIEEYDEDDYDTGSGTEFIPKGVLTEEQEDVLAEIIRENKAELVEDVVEYFVGWPQELKVQPLEPELSKVDFSDPVVEKTLKCTRSDIQRTQFLTSPYLMIMSSSPWSMPRSLFRWLVHVVSVEQNQSITLSVFAMLQRVFSQRTSLLGVDHLDLIRAFKIYGARQECLEGDWKVQPVTPATNIEREIFPDTKKFPRQNLKAVIKLVNMTATLDPQFYDIPEIRKIMNLLLRITTDPIIGDCKSLLGSTMVALLDTIPASAWETQRQIICEEIIQTLGTSSPFILLVLRQLPSLSVRITLLRRSIALAYLNQPPIPAGRTAPDLEELYRALFVDKGFSVNSETNYKELGRRVQILSFCLDDERMIASYGRVALEPMLRRLRYMNGRIIDIRAAFMDRTWAKDIIQRLYMRLYYGGVHRQISAQTTLNFGSSLERKNDSKQDTNINGELQSLKLVPLEEKIKSEESVPLFKTIKSEEG
ncbi:hypothetical protein BGZ76_006999 [Entomortierella beljakovae]|nr:hypothetical protein BGZ76_006999 [Entomortierella beljakovae]